MITSDENAPSDLVDARKGHKATGLWGPCPSSFEEYLTNTLPASNGQEADVIQSSSADSWPEVTPKPCTNLTVQPYLSSCLPRSMPDSRQDQMIQRQKVLNACNNCRARKVKCDARRPKCSKCAQKPGTSCVYQRRSATQRGSPGSDTTASAAPSPAFSRVEEPNAMTGDVENPPRSAQFFGSSSAGQFARQINLAVDTHLNTAPAQALETVGRSAFDLPERETADALLDAYIYGIFNHFPIHDWPRFKASYEKLRTTTESAPKTFHCLLYTIFALGAQFLADRPPEERKEMGISFRNKARQHYANQLDLEPCVEGVVCLLLLALFSQTTTDSTLVWTSTGAAIRMAQSLGLHLDTEGPFRETQFNRRVWLGCLYMDRIVSITLGRPLMLPLRSTSVLPLMIDEEMFDSQTEESFFRPDGTPARMAFYLKAFELNDVYHDISLELYETVDDQRLSAVLQFDTRLTKWRASLPGFLEFGTLSSVMLRQRLTLHLRYLHARMVVFRPIVSDFYLRRKPDESLATHLILKCASLCFEAAHEIISVMYEHANLTTLTGPIPSWWYVVLFLYSAATVLLAERLQPTGDSRPPDSWEKALEMLRAYSRYGDSAKRCCTALEVLNTKVLNESDNALDVPFDFDMDFNVEDMMWLSSFGGDLMFAN